MKKLEELIEETREIYPYKKVGDSSTYNDYNQGWEDACDILGEKVKTYFEENSNCYVIQHKRSLKVLGYFTDEELAKKYITTDKDAKLLNLSIAE